MKKFFQIVLVYVLGILCVFTFVLRANSLDDSNKKLVSNYQNEVNIYNE